MRALVLATIILMTTGCAGMFQKGKPVHNANTAINLGSVAWAQYISVERFRCKGDTTCLDKIEDRDEGAQVIIMTARQHLTDFQEALDSGEIKKARYHMDALEELAMGLDPKHFQDTFDVLGQLRHMLAEKGNVHND